MPRTLSLSGLTPWMILLRTSLICCLLGAVLFGLTLKRIEPLPISQTEPQFKADRAFRTMRTLAKTFPNRVTWSANRIKAAEWIKQELKKLGYEPKGLQFSEVIESQLYTNLENIYVEKKGTSHPQEIIVVMAHYDITDTTIEGAMDDASGVGVVLELAKIFAHEETDRTILFLLTDSEEFGAFWGARAFAQSYEYSNQIVAAANFDFISPGHQTKILTLCDGLKTGYTPLWLREIALNSLRSLGTIKAIDMDGLEEFIERAMLIPPADHGAFLATGIPAFNWVGQTDHFAYVMAHFHHTPYDVAEALDPKSFDAYGKGAERVIRTIDRLPRIPVDFRDSSYWKISSRYYLPGWAVTLLHILAFIPFLGYSIAKFGKSLQNSSKSRILDIVKNETKGIAIVLGSLLAGYAVMLLLPALKVIALYEIFPATQKSHILYRPNFLAILLVSLFILAIYWVFKKTFSEPDDSSGNVEVRHSVHAAFLAIIIILAFFKNSYLAVLLLLPPAYFWTAIRAQRRISSRMVNGLLLLGGSITLMAIVILLSTIFHLGVFYWYLFLSVAYGLISTYSVILFFMALTVMIRLFRSFVLYNFSVGGYKNDK